jgi:hypothetical protein
VDLGLHLFFTKAVLQTMLPDVIWNTGSVSSIFGDPNSIHEEKEK